MKKLETAFAGLRLKNPFIVSSSNLTNSVEKNKKWEEAGAGAVVLKSLFQEEIESEANWMNEGVHTEELDYLQTYQRAHRLEQYLRLIKETKAVCTIPVIASINCFRLAEWMEFAKQISQAGVDAIELNIMSVNAEIEDDYGTFERLNIRIVQEIKRVVDVPIIIKLSRNLTNPISLIHQLYANGVAGVVLFNRMAAPDFNIDTLKFAYAEALGHPSDLYESLRWVGLSSNRVPNLSYAVSGGVSDGISLVKALLAGASAVEVCTALYQKGVPQVYEMLAFLSEWMAQHNFTKVSEFKGLMNARKTGNASVFARNQFFKQFGKYE